VRRTAGRAAKRAELHQLALPLEEHARTGEEMLARLRALGLDGITSCRLTQNRAVMVSFSRGALRVHRAYLAAPADVLRAIVRFVRARTRRQRRAAERVLLGYPVHASGTSRPPARRPERPRPGDAALVAELAAWHRDYNRRHFGAALQPVAIRISGRMRSRLGQYTAASPAGEPAEIAIARAHIRRHGWGEVLHTLLHEMVHQWQAETGHALDHGRSFRAQAREVGIAPGARREVCAAGAGATPAAAAHELSLRAAREE
jgi:hypothetical protein